MNKNQSNRSGFIALQNSHSSDERHELRTDDNSVVNLHLTTEKTVIQKKVLCENSGLNELRPFGPVASLLSNELPSAEQVNR